MTRRRGEPKGPLAEIRAKLREAEKVQLPIGRENVSLDHDDYNALVLLIERKVGKKADVLRQAVSAGLRVLIRGTEPDAGYAEVDSPDVGDDTIEPHDETIATTGLSALARAALGRAEHGTPITTPPSANRERLDETDGEDADPAE